MSSVRVRTERGWGTFEVVSVAIVAGRSIEQSLPFPRRCISSTVPGLLVEYTREQRLCMSVRAVGLLFGGSSKVNVTAGFAAGCRGLELETISEAAQ
jgi:hypothetical protein